MRSIVVEGEPIHCAYLKDVFWEMGVPDEQLRLVETAISEEDGEGYFPVGNPREWWGQQLAPSDTDTRGFYWNDENDVDNLRIQEERVVVLSLRTLIEDEPIIDLISFDIQNSEYHVIKGATSPEGEGILDRVKTMVISTHATDIEQKIFSMLCSHGWLLVFCMPVTYNHPDNLNIVNYLQGQRTVREVTVR